MFEYLKLTKKELDADGLPECTGKIVMQYQCVSA
jgi:hypothetical protein